MLAALTIGAALAATPDPLAASLTLNTTAPVTTTPHLQIITDETDGSLLVYDGTDMVTPWQLARMTGDTEGIRRGVLRTGGAALGAGALGAVAVGGSFVAAAGAFAGMFYLTDVAFSGPRSDGTGLMIAGLIVGGAAVGTLGYLGAAAVGAYYFHRIRSTDTWYTDDELRERVDAYNGGLGVSERPRRWMTVRPVVSLNGLGLAGTF